MALPFDRLRDTMAHALDFRLQRGNMIAANLANVDTPDYTPVEMKFDTQLRGFLDGQSPHQLNRTSAGHRLSTENLHLDPVEEGFVEFDTYALPDQTGNSVDMDHENAKLAENQLMYRTIIAAYNKRGWYSRILEQ